MGDRTGTPEEVVVLLPEPVGSGRTGGEERPVDLGGAGLATHVEVELDVAQGIAPLSRAAETLLKQGKRYIVMDLSRFQKLKADELKGLVETRERCARAHGALMLSGVQRDVAATLRLLELDKQLETFTDERTALDAAKRRIEERRELEKRLGDLSIDVHVLTVAKGKPTDESFLDRARRKGPEGLPREVVVVEIDDKGASKLVEKIRATLKSGIPNVVIDLSQVSALEGPAVKDLLKAEKLVEEKGGYMAVAGAREAVAGLLKVMGLDREMPTLPSRDKALEDFKEDLLDKIDKRAPKAAAKGGPGERGGPGETSRIVVGEPGAPGAAVERAGAGPGDRRGPGETSRMVLGGETGKVITPAGETQKMPAVTDKTPPPAEPRGKGRLEVVEEKDALVVRQPGVKPAKEETADAPLQSLDVEAGGLADLPRAVQIAASQSKSILVSLALVTHPDPAAIKALVDSTLSARERGARLAVFGGSKEVLTVLKLLDVQKTVEVHDTEGAAVEALGTAVLATAKGKKAVRFSRKRVPVGTRSERPKTMVVSVPELEEEEDEDEKKPQKTMQFSAPTFLEEEEEETKKPQKTAQFAAPTFLDEDEDEEKPAGAVKATPDFDDEDEKDEKKPQKTMQFSSPAFLDEEEEETKKPQKTMQFSAPSFLEEEEEEGGDAKRKGAAAKDDEKKPQRTMQFAAPSFEDEEDDEEAEEKPKEVVAAAPDFDEEDEGEEKHEKTGKFEAPTFSDDDEEEAPKVRAPGKGRTVIGAVPNFEDEGESKESKEKKGPAEERGKGKTVIGAVPNFEDEGESKEKKGPGEERPRTQMIATPDLEKELSKPVQPGEERPKTQMIAAPDLEKEVSKATTVRPAAKGDEPSSQQRTAIRPAAKEEPPPAARTVIRPAAKLDEPPSAQTKTAKTEKVPEAPSGEMRTVIRPAAKLDDAPPADLKSAKTEKFIDGKPEKAEAPKPGDKGKPPDKMKSAKTEELTAIREALKPEEVGKTQIRPAMKPDEPSGQAKKSMKTEEIPAAELEKAVAAERMKTAKTEMFQSPAELKGAKTDRIDPTKTGFETTRTEKIETDAIEAAAAKGAAARGGDIREAKTQAMTGLSRDEAMRIASEQTAKLIGAKKVGGPEGKPGAQEKPTAERPAAAAGKAAEGDVQVRKTEAMAGLSAEEAKRLAEEEKKSAKTEVDFKAAKTGADFKAAKTELEVKAAAERKTDPERKATGGPGDMQVAKTQAMAGLSREDALKQLEQEKKGGAPAAPAAATASQPGKKPAPPPTVALKAAPAEDVQVRKTEAMAGLSREEAEKKAAEEKARGAKTEMLQAPSKADAEKAVREMKTQAMTSPSKADAEKAVRDMKTQAMAAPSKADAEKAVRDMKTQAMAAPSKAEAEQAVRQAKTEMLQSPSRGDAQKMATADVRVMKTEALPGLSADKARELAGGRGPRGAESGETAKVGEAEARPSRTPMIALLVVLLLGGGFGLWKFVLSPTTPTKPTPTITTPPPPTVDPTKKGAETLKKVETMMPAYLEDGYDLN